MKPLDLEQLKKLPLCELVALQSMMEETHPFFMQEGRMDIYIKNGELVEQAVTHKIACYHGVFPEPEAFDFKKWLAENGWDKTLNDYGEFQKKFNTHGTVGISMNEYFFDADIMGTKKYVFENCRTPTTKQEAETLFKLFNL
jgi:hypothetical protein